MYPGHLGSYDVSDPAIAPLATYLEVCAAEVVLRAERAWESSILLFAELTEEQHEEIRRLAIESVRIWASRLRQDPTYPRQVHELGQEWGRQAAGWQLHVYSFTKALELLGHATWEYLAETYDMRQLSPPTVFFLGRSRDQVLDDLRVPLLATYLQRREVEMEETRFSLQGELSLPGRSLLTELGNRLRANQDRVVPSWVEQVQNAPGATPMMIDLVERRGATLVELLLSLLLSPTPETGAASLAAVRAVGLESAQAGVSFQEMFHALQQLRPILWDTVYEVYHREQYWHPAEFIEALARLHLLLDLFSEGIGQAYLRQKEMIIQDQAEGLRRRDLDLARQILENLLPSRTLELPHTQVGAAWVPAREIGGDFYDIFPVSNEEVMLLIGDVSGKGISAALLVSMVKYVLKANAPWNASPAQLLTVANRLLATDMGSEMFVTMFAARYNPRTGRLRYTSAGHDPCYVCRREGSPATVVLNSRGPVLGVFPEIELTDGEATLREGDVLLLYTDGLVNVRCHGRMPENSRRLCSHVRNAMAQPAEQIVQALLHDATEGCEPTDDITVLLLKREGAATA